MEDANTRKILSAIEGLKSDIVAVQTTLNEHTDLLNNHTEVLEKHTESLQKIVRVIAGPMPNAINNLEDALNRPKTDFFAKVREPS